MSYSLFVALKKEGGTLSKIAKQEGISLKAILFTNANLDPRRIQIGQKIAIPETEDDLLASAQTHIKRIRQTIDKKPDKEVGNEPKKRCGEYKITVELLNNLVGNSGSWFMGRGGKGKTYKAEYSTYTQVHGFNKKEFIKILKKKIKKYNIDKTCHHVAHFLSQIIHESAHFDTTLEYGNGHN